MKMILKSMLLFLSLGFVLSCSKTNDNQENTENSDVSQIENTVQSGTWRISYFYDTDHEETTNFSGYTFTFKTDGNLVATNGNTTVSGTWSISDNSSSSSSEEKHFNIFFTAPPDFENLSDDWTILSVTNLEIKLTDVSGGNGGTDFLTFEKI